MTAPRILAVSPDRAFGHQLATALKRASSAVEVHDRLDALGAAAGVALCVVYLDATLVAAARERLTRLACPLVVVLPRANLAAVVDLMIASDRVVAMMVAEDVDLRELAALAARILADRVFGLEQVMPEAAIRSQRVGDYRAMARCVAEVAAFAEQQHVPRAFREPIEQCLEEMLMNALYDAPVDEGGAPAFAGVPARTRVTLKTEFSAAVQYGHDGNRFAIAVRDAFGSLQRETVLRYVHKCIHDPRPVDRKAGGAGVGLYLMLTSSSAVYFHVLPGFASEALCVFDLESAKPQLAQLGLLVQTDPTGHVAAKPAHVSPAGSRLVRGARRARIPVAVTTAVLLALAAWPHLFPAKPARLAVSTIPAGATVEVDERTIGTTADGPAVLGGLAVGRDVAVSAQLDGYAPKQATVHLESGDNAVTLELAALPRVELDTRPTGATVTVDGKPAGATPLALTSLAPGATVAVAFERTGYRRATATVHVPAGGQVVRLVQPLEASADFVRVHFVSTPPGAEIVHTGEPPPADRTYTPADVLVEANHMQRFTLTMPGHRPLVIEPFTPAPGATGLEKGGPLVPLK